MQYLTVKKYSDFQHYSKRNPPWIKLYSRLLSDLEFKLLTEVQQIHLVMIWLLASRLDNKIPYDESYVRAAIGAKRKVDLKGLVDAGWLIVLNASADASNGRGRHASKPAAPSASTSAVEAASAASMPPYAREEVTESSENYNNTSHPPRARAFAAPDLSARLASDRDRAALDELLSRVPSPHAWAAEMTASLDGMPGHVLVTPEQLGKANRDYLANGAIEKANMRQYRRYLSDTTKLFEPASPTRRPASAEIDPNEHFAAEMERIQREEREKENQHA